MARWEEIQQGIFEGESGGDYNALFNFQNREDGRFSDVKLTDMTIDEALAFADPQGDYARYVASLNEGQISTPMGAYQIVGRTLRDAKNALNLDGDIKMTPSTQDKIAKWILKTQGTKAWAGYKGDEVRAGDKSMVQPNKLNALQMQQMSQRPTGLLGMLQQTGNKLKNFDIGDPNTRAVLASFSRSPVGEKLQQLAIGQRDLQLKKDVANRTAAYLRTQEGGEPYAQAIEAGMDPKAVYNEFIGRGLNSSSVQSSNQLPDGSGYSFVMRDGSIGVRLLSNEILTGEVARRYLEASRARKADIDRRTAGAKTLGKEEFADAREKLGQIDRAELRANQAVNRAQAIIDNQNLAGITGRIDGMRSTFADSGKNDLVILINQFADTLGEQAFQSLKGAGAITENELRVATNALINLDRSQTPRQFISQMEEIKQYLTDGLNVARKDAERLNDLLNNNMENYEPVPPIDLEAIKAGVGGGGSTTEAPANSNETVLE